MRRGVEYYEDKEYKEVDGKHIISLDLLMKVDSIFPFPKNELDIYLRHNFSGATQDNIAKFYSKKQSGINYTVNVSIPTHTARICELIEIIPDVLKAYEKLQMDPKYRFYCTHTIYTGKSLQAAKINKKQGIDVNTSTYLHHIKLFRRRCLNIGYVNVANYIERWIMHKKTKHL